MLDLTDDHLAIRAAIQKLMEPFGEEYWAECDREHRFPEEFRAAMAKGGWLGIAMPEDFGGAGLGVLDAVVMMEAIAHSPGGMAAASSVHMNVFGPECIVLHGTEEQKAEWLPKIVAGEMITCFGVTEPDAGLDTTKITTTARRTNEGYLIDGRKIWTSTAQQAERCVLLARTTPLDEVEKPTEGLTLFFAPLDADHVEIREIAKMGRHAVNSNMVFYDGLKVGDGDRIGDEGQGFRILLDSLNPERCLIAAEAIGVGRQALGLAAEYARERRVFGRPIGQNQGIQFPIASAYARMKAAALMVERAAGLYDAGSPCGEEANMAKMLAAEASWQAADMCVQTHGGFGFAEEYDVERKFRETRLYQVAPISTNLILAYLAEHVLDLPRSY